MVVQTVEGMIDRDGVVRLLEPVFITGPRRALVTILPESLEHTTHETTLLSEAALAADWNRAEEDAAWAYLQPEK